MALLKLEPNQERVEEIAQRMKEIIETTWLRDPKLNDKEIEEFEALRKDLNDMGLFINFEVNLCGVDSGNPKLRAEINIWTTKNMTVH